MAAVVQTLLANVLILGINVATGIITARLLGPAGRGEQAAIILWPQFLAFALTLGLPSALLYNLKRYPDRGPQMLYAALFVGTFMGGIVVAVGVLLIPRWLAEYPPEVVRFAQWAMLFSPMMLLSFAFTFVLQAREEFFLYNAVRYLNPLLTLLALLALVSVHHLTPFSAALAYLLPTIPIFLWMLARLWSLYHPIRRGSGWALRRLISYGLRSCGLDLLGQLSLQLDRVLVVGLLSPAAMGLYVVAWSLAQMLNVFQTAAASVLFPKASGRSIEEAVSLTGRTARVGIAVTMLVAGGLALFSPWALGLLYGREYLDAIPVFRLLLCVVVLQGTEWVLLQTFMAVNRPGAVTLLGSIGLSLSVPLLLVLVPRYGLEGAGLALLISGVVRFAFIVASFPLILKKRPPRLLLTRADIGAVAEAFRKRKVVEGR